MEIGANKVKIITVSLLGFIIMVLFLGEIYVSYPHVTHYSYETGSNKNKWI